MRHFHSGYLSLLDLGDEYLEINTNQIYGCNLSIRKDVLFELGGFNPDGMPPDLIKYRGDGETALMTRVVEGGYKTVYNPKACVYHVIPSSRLTIDYFKRRSFNQGVSDSFSLIKKYGKIDGNIYRIWLSNINIVRKITAFIRFMLSNNRNYIKYQNEVRNAYLKGVRFHRNEVKNDPELLEYILQDNYFV